MVDLSSKTEPNLISMLIPFELIEAQFTYGFITTLLFKIRDLPFL